MYLLKRIQINLIGWIISGSLLLTSIFAQYVGAGIHDVATLFIPITLGVAGLMMNKNHFVFFSIIAVLMETSISYMQINSLTSGIVSETAEVVDYFVPPILFFSFSILLFFAAFQYRAALEDTESAMRRYRDIFSSTKDGIIITSLDGYILDSNNSLAINIGIEKSLDYIQDLPNWNREIHLQIGDQKEVQFDWIYSSGKEGLTNNKIIYVRANQIKIRDTQQIIWIFQDVTKARQLTELSHQADKIRAIGQLASGIAHDFNNQTAGMVGMVERLNTYCKDIPEASEYLNQILYKHYHAGEQISQLLSLGKPQVRNKTAVNIYEIVKQSSTFLNQNYDQHIEFIFNLKTEQTTIFANRSQIENIVLNLLLNARDSMSDGGTITIDIKENNRDHVPGIQLLITDTGLGMDDESIRCAFEPFYTTRDEGTGLGLFMVYTNIEAHNGHIELQSKIGEGTTVNIWLPTELSFPVDNLAPKSASVNTLKKHILLIEDNLTIAESTEIQLSHRGYTVGCAYSGSEAIEYCKNHFDLHCILLDVMLPDTTGDILFPTLKDLHPQTPIIVISGFASKSVIDNLINAGASAFISKPYRFSTLDTQIQSLISK
jgi:signal transduction histidine kinase